LTSGQWLLEWKQPFLPWGRHGFDGSDCG